MLFLYGMHLKEEVASRLFYSGKKTSAVAWIPESLASGLVEYVQKIIRLFSDPSLQLKQFKLLWCFCSSVLAMVFLLVIIKHVFVLTSSKCKT